MSPGETSGLKAIRPRRACLACRQLKAKCIPTEASISSKAPCKRCTQMDLKCEYLARKRRRASPASGGDGDGSETRHLARRKSSRDISEHRESQTETPLSRHYISPPSSYPKHPTTFTPPGQPNHRVPDVILASSQSSIYPFTATSSTSQVPFGLADVHTAALHPNTPRPIVRARYQPPTGVISHLTVKAPIKPVPVLDMIQKLDPGSVVSESSNSASSSHTLHHVSQNARTAEQTSAALGPDQGSFHTYSADDPILALGMYVQDAWELFDQYLLEMIQVSAELDPVYNTFQSVRLRSPVLLSSILYASARFHRPLLAPLLQAHARTLAYRAVSTNDCAIETVQALFILTFWKNPADQTAWMDSGCAIRMGQALGLHRSIEKTIGKGIWDEKEKREVVAAQRTWYALCCLDHTWSNHATGLPPAIPLNYCYGAREWALTTAEPDNRGDYQLACSLEFSCQLHSHVSVADEWEGAHMTEAVLEGLRRSEMAIEQHRAYWYTPPMLDRMTCQTKALTQSFVGLQYCEIKYDQHRLRPDVYPRDDVLSAVEMAVTLAVRLAGSGVMHFLSDGCNLRISRIGTMLFELFEHADDRTRQRLQEHVLDILDALEPLIKQPIETSCMYIARYYRRLQEVFDHTMRTKAIDPSLSTDQSKTEQVPAQSAAFEPEIDPLAFEQFWQHLPVEDPDLASWLELANGFPLADLPLPPPH